MNKKIITIAKKYAKIIEKSGIKIDALYLFGSKVKDTRYKWSDLDTCVISPDFGKDRIAEMANLFYLAKDIPDNIEPHPFSPEEFNDKYNFFAKEIKRTGIRII